VTNNDEELLSDLLLQWEELYERGQDTPADQLCGSNQRLVDELSQRIAALKATNWLKDPNPSPIEDLSTDSQAKESRPARVLVNRYRLDHLIAEGGFAQVWRAYDKELQRIVAVKIPKPSRLESTDSFLAEARRVARLKHPGIVPVHDVGVENGTCFIVSEFVEGGSLGDQLARFSPTPEQVVRWITEIADALEYAHLHGVIHRDIKPANILIDHHGRALLADFGIAQSANKTGSFAPSLGTLRYMAPEQLDGQSATPASDIFSLGLVLHESLAGKLPYSSDSPSVVRREIAQGLHKAVSQTIPGSLRPVCEKALNREPQKRHTSATHFCSDLKAAWKKKPPRNLWWWIVLTPVIFLLACVLIGFVLLSLIRSHAEVVRKQTQERIDRDMRGTPAPEDINKIQDRLYEPGGLVDSIRKMTEELGKDAAKKTAEEDKPDSNQ
jgi:eukaryotic-like serine/threonine-protein kinase